MSEKLTSLIERARQVRMTPSEIREQRISFAFGNANYEDQRVTKEAVTRASELLSESYDSRGTSSR
jgi:hypothetical protein